MSKHFPTRRVEVRERLSALETFGIKLGLENIRRLCAALDHPERSFTAIHVAGTNGKGSVTAFVHAALVAAGVRAARYTSPHLVELRERFVIGSAPVDAAELDQVGTTVLDTADRLLANRELGAPPTYFEATTAMAFELFRRAGTQVAVIEVGLGGRFDATNVLNPPLGAITSIGLDHQQHLGDTVGQIAFEKAGIIKPGMIVITGHLPADAEIVIAEAADERRAVILPSMKDVEMHAVFKEGVATITLRTPLGEYGSIPLSLRGEHQVGNALVAVRLLEALRRTGIEIPTAAIAKGLTDAEWPARLELLPLAPGRALLIDAAHNVQGAQALAAYLGRWHPERPPLVIGAMADKDVSGILSALLPVSSTTIATSVGTPRSMPASEIARRAALIDPARHIEVVSSPPDAARRALDLSTGVACVAGSIYLAGTVRDAVKRRAILH